MGEEDAGSCRKDKGMVMAEIPEASKVSISIFRFMADGYWDDFDENGQLILVEIPMWIAAFDMAQAREKMVAMRASKNLVIMRDLELHQQTFDPEALHEELHSRGRPHHVEEPFWRGCDAHSCRVVKGLWVEVQRLEREASEWELIHTNDGGAS